MERNKISSAVVPSEIYNKMMDSSAALSKQIKRKIEKGNEIVTQEEIDFVCAFSEYAKELVDVLKKQRQ